MKKGDVYPDAALFTFTRGIQRLQKSATRAGLLARKNSVEFLHTVARPRGIHTRFPILPALLTRGTRTLLIEKI